MPCGMGLGQPVGELNPIAEGFVELEAAAPDDLVEGLPLDELHDHEVDPPVRGDIVDDDDVRVAEGRGGLGLLDEAASALGVGDLAGRQDLDGDGPVEVGVDGLVDRAHAAFTDLFGDPVMKDRLSDQAGIVHLSHSPQSPYKAVGVRKVNQTRLPRGERFIAGFTPRGDCSRFPLPPE